MFDELILVKHMIINHSDESMSSMISFCLFIVVRALVSVVRNAPKQS